MNSQLLLLLPIVLLVSASALRPGLTAEAPWPVYLLASAYTTFVGLRLSRMLISPGSRHIVASFSLFWSWLIVTGLIHYQIDPFQTCLALAKWTFAAAVYWGLISQVHRVSHWRLVAFFAFALSTVLSLWGILVFLVNPTQRLTSTFTNADSFAPFPTVGLLLSCGLLAKRNWRLSGFVHVGIVIQFAALFLSGSRGAWFAFGIGLAILLVSQRKFTETSGITKESLPLFGYAALLVSASLLIPPGIARWKHLATHFNDEAYSLRKIVFLNSRQAILSNPVSGLGPGSFALAFQRYRPVSPIPSKIRINVAHNDFLEIAFETGVVGLFLWLCLAGSLIERGWRNGLVTPYKSESASSLAALGSLYSFSAFQFFVAVPADLLLFSTIAALNSCSYEEPDSSAITGAWRLICRASGLLFTTLGLAWFTFSCFGLTSYQLRKKGDSLLRQGASESAERAYSRAIEWMPIRTDLYIKRAYVQRERVNHSPAEIEKAAASLQQALSFSPFNLQARLAMAVTLQDLGRLEESAQLLESTQKWATFSDEVRQLQVNNLEANRDWTRAAQIAIEVYSRNTTYLPRLTRLLHQSEVTKSGTISQILLSHPLEPERLKPLLNSIVESLTHEKAFKSAESIYIMEGRLLGQSCNLWSRIASLWRTAGNREKEWSALLEATQSRYSLASDYESALSKLSLLGIQMGRTRLAEEKLVRHIDAAGAGPESFSALAQIYLSQSNHKKTRELIASALEIHEHNPQLLLVRAQLALQEGSPDSALEDAKDVLEVEPRNMLAKALLRQAERALSR